MKVLLISQHQYPELSETLTKLELSLSHLTVEKVRGGLQAE